MRSKSTLAIAMGVLLCSLPAMAQQSPPPITPPAAGAGAAGQQAGANGSIRQHIMHDLEQAGFKNVKLTPSAFVAQATDPKGNPVMMLINPDSITTLTAVDSPVPSGSNPPTAPDTSKTAK